MTGVICSWFPERLFGFIRPDEGGRQVFIHQSAANTPLSKGAHVEYEFGEDREGRRCATRVEVIP